MVWDLILFTFSVRFLAIFFLTFLFGYHSAAAAITRAGARPLDGGDYHSAGARAAGGPSAAPRRRPPRRRPLGGPRTASDSVKLDRDTLRLRGMS